MLTGLGVGLVFGGGGRQLVIVEDPTVLYPVLSGDYLTGFTDVDNSLLLEPTGSVVTGVGAAGETAISGNFRNGYGDPDQFWVGAS